MFKLSSLQQPDENKEKRHIKQTEAACSTLFCSGIFHTFVVRDDPTFKPNFSCVWALGLNWQEDSLATHCDWLIKNRKHTENKH